MTTTILQPDQREQLLAFVDRSLPDAAYLRRARIVLLADEGQAHEAIAAQLQVPIQRVRHFLAAFHRQGMQLFPPTVLQDPFEFSADDPVDEAARKIMARRLQNVMAYTAALETETDVTSLHETRKGIRELRTALRLFEPYYRPGLLQSYRKRFRKTMRRLARSRDLAVFLWKLEGYIEGTGPEAASEPLQALATYWRRRLLKADEKVRAYLSKGKYQALLADLQAFTSTEGEGSLKKSEEPTVRQMAPGHIRKQIAALLAGGEALAETSPARLHELRIQTKELRYTLEFYQPALGPQADEAIATVKVLLLHLGDINDARVHLGMLAKTSDPDLAPSVNAYRQVLTAEMDRLVAELPALWEPLTQAAWQEQIDGAIAAL